MRGWRGAAQHFLIKVIASRGRGGGPNSSRGAAELTGVGDTARGNELTQLPATMRGVGMTQATLQVRGAAKVFDELRRVARGCAPLHRDRVEEIGVGVDEGAGIRKKGMKERPRGVRREVPREVEHGLAPPRADVA